MLIHDLVCSIIIAFIVSMLPRPISTPAFLMGLAIPAIDCIASSGALLSDR